MTTFSKLTLSVISSLSLSACSVFGIRSGVPEVPFTVIERVSDVEIRAYGSRVAAEVTNARDTSEAFYLLFDYISGANQDKRAVTMTAPVEVNTKGRVLSMTAPVEVREAADNSVSMRFFLPQDYTIASAPVPNDPRVKLTELAPDTFAAIRYSGTSNDMKFRMMRDRIETSLEQTSWKIVGEPHFFGFDPPFTIPFFRRNEVMVKVENRTPYSKPSGSF